MPTFDRITCLKTLECNATATPVEIYRSYKLLRKKYHPDTLVTGNADLFVKVTDAYETLKENFIIDVTTISEENEDTDDDYKAPDSLKIERQRQRELKEKLGATLTEENLHRKIIDALLDKLETHKNVTCSIVLQPNYVMSILIILEDVYAKMIVDVRRSDGGSYSGKLQFSTDKKSATPKTPFITLLGEQLKRIWNSIAFLDFDIKYLDDDKWLYADELRDTWPTSELFKANKSLSYLDMYSAIRMHGISKSVRVSEFRDIIERRIEAVILKAELSYSTTWTPIKVDTEQGEERYYPSYVKANLGISSATNRDEYYLFPDGNVYIWRSLAFKERCLQIISNTRIRDLVKNYYGITKKDHEEELERKLTEQLKEENEVLSRQLQVRKDLENILGNLKRDLIE